jgi:hypothetical protein
VHAAPTVGPVVPLAGLGWWEPLSGTLEIVHGHSSQHDVDRYQRDARPDR